MNSERPIAREIEHTADLGFEVTAADLPALLSAAGEALFGLIADASGIETREEMSVGAAGESPEELLHGWLCELLAQFNLTGFIARRCEVLNLDGKRVAGRLRGEKLDLKRHSFRTEIKGVTYHGFKVWEEQGMWRARVICDV